MVHGICRGGVLDSLGGEVAHVQGSPVGNYGTLFSGYLVSMDSHLEIKAGIFVSSLDGTSPVHMCGSGQGG